MQASKRFVSVLLVTACAGAAFTTASAQTVSAPVVVIQSGKVAGAQAGSVAVFKGLPYAAPPVGTLRWREPMRVAAWKGMRQADAFGPACMQAPGAAELAGAGAPGPLSEDCLTLNLWTPGPEATAKRPVMVWIHGGALVFGSGRQQAYDGSALAARGVVVVTINYRMGALGFFDHPALAGQGDGIVNYGLLDQVAALQWIRDNISAFGGDPGNITLFGESAGAQSVLALFASPKARGLFHRGIAQSPYGIPSHTREKARTVSINVSTAVGLDGARATAAQLRAVPASRFGAAFKGEDLTLAPGFVVGDAVLPQTILATFQQGRQANLPLVIGNNSDEATVATAFGLDPAEIVQRLGAGKVLLKPLYPGVSNNAQLGREVVRDLVFTAFARRIAYLHSQSAPTWRYYFSHVQTGLRPPPPGVGHGGEIVYVMGTGDACNCLPARFSDADRAVSRIVGDYWTAFARTGVPAVAGSPTWPRDGVRRPQVMEFTRMPNPRADFMRTRLNVMIRALNGIGGYLQRGQ